MKKAHLIISGRVQGVSFRWFVRGLARKAGLTGMVKNLADGTVEIWVEGTESQISNLIDQMRQGNGISSVTGIEQTWPEYAGTFLEFNIVF